MSFTQKAITCQFSLAQGQFGSGGGNSFTTPSGLRCSARITLPGGYDQGNLSLAIYGLPLSVMNQLTILPLTATGVGKNEIVVMAGDAPNPQYIAFTGTIDFAYCDATKQPEVCLRVEAVGGLVERIKPVPAVSQAGSVDVATLMGQLAQSIGRTLENNSVQKTIQNPHLPGAALQQIAMLARAAGIMWSLEKDVLAIWNPGQARQGNAVTISKDTGMVAYPAFTRSGIIVTTEYVGTIEFGSQITVQSELKPACGNWYVSYMEHALDCYTPGGSWFTTLQAGPIEIGTSSVQESE